MVPRGDTTKVVAFGHRLRYPTKRARPMSEAQPPGVSSPARGALSTPGHFFQGSRRARFWRVEVGIQIFTAA
jgi:hypothetical protein